METLYSYHYDWTNVFSFMIPLLIGTAFLLFIKPAAERKEKGYAFFKWLFGIVGCFCIILSVCSFTFEMKDHSFKKSALENGRVLVTEGYVKNFHPMPPEGHDMESFEIDGVYFEYSSYETVNGYNVPSCSGGVITGDGQHLLIKYVTGQSGRNVILYIAKIE